MSLQKITQKSLQKLILEVNANLGKSQSLSEDYKGTKGGIHNPEEVVVLENQ